MIVIKYLQFICIAISLESILCDSLLLESSKHDEGLFREITCTATCLLTNMTTILSNCYEECINVNQTMTFNETNSTDTIRLICRESDTLIVEIFNSPASDNRDSNGQSHSNVLLFLVKVRESNNASAQQIVYMSNTAIVMLENLQKNTDYNVTATIFTKKLEYRQISAMHSYKTLATDDYIPQMVLNDSITLRYAAKENSSAMVTTIEWKPTADMICNYNFLLYPTRDEDYLTSFEQHFGQLKPNEFYHLTIETLSFETEYIFEMYGINSKHSFIEGNKSGIEFITPTCWQILGYNLDKCRPEPISNIKSTFDMITSDIYGINVTWDLPKHIPDYHDVTLNLFSGRGNFQSQNVSGFRSYAYFPYVNMSSQVKYDVQIDSISKGGHTIHPIVEFSLKVVHAPDFPVRSDALIFGILLAFIVCVVFVIAMIRIRNSQLKLAKEFFEDEIHLQKIIRSHNKDKMEIDPLKVELHELLGEGAFGIVRRGILWPNNCDIAVKMLKKDATSEDIKCFLSEITLMKSVGKHENILGIIGHSMKTCNNMMLLTEYCSEGNLLNYLRKFREILSKIQPLHESEPNTLNIVCNQLYNILETENILKSQSRSVTNENTDFVRQMLVENRGYGLEPSKFECFESNCKDNQEFEMENIDKLKLYAKYNQLTAGDLLNFAKQIATGMDFLASNKIVHRDLAARNVLVCADKTIKIADFGLSRDIYVDQIYMKTSTGRFPIKWLALESMIDQKYTSQSDVWSFGILLYEIVTLGCTPYPTVQVECLINYLTAGNRIPKPSNCSQSLFVYCFQYFFYELMLTCWDCEPEKRPTFSGITKTIDHFIQRPELNDINIAVDMKSDDGSCDPIEMDEDSNTSYLTPLWNRCFEAQK